MENHILLDIAKKSIKSKFDNSIKPNREELLKDFPDLKEEAATFVTLTLDGNLRGCIGTLYAHRSLLDDLMSNSYSAAFEDPRFYELTKEEFEKVKVEVSILSKPEKVEYENINELKEKIKPNIHGVILQKNNRRSTFLPQVWEKLPSFEEFISHLCHKGGFEANCLQFSPEVFIYTVKKIK